MMTVHAIPQADILHVMTEGEFSLSEAKRTFLDVIHMVGELRLGKILFDGQQIIGNPVTIERFYYGEFVADEVNKLIADGWDDDLRFAYVLLEPVLDELRLGETVAVNRGMNVRAFDNRVDAITWLGWRTS